MWKPDVPTPEYRTWRIEYEQFNADLNEFLFRVMEMALFIGAVWYIEDRVKFGHGISLTLTAIMANFCRSKIMLITLPALERYNISEAWRRRIYWLYWAVAIGLWFGISITLQEVVPILARNQG